MKTSRKTGLMERNDIRSVTSSIICLHFWAGNAAGMAAGMAVGAALFVLTRSHLLIHSFNSELLLPFCRIMRHIKTKEYLGVFFPSKCKR